MSIAFHQIRADCLKGKLGFLISGCAENISSEIRGAAQGFHLGSRVFDAATGTLIYDGKRTPFSGNFAPGETGVFRLEVLLPGEPGRYQIFVSLVREGNWWSHERGWPFLLVEAEVVRGEARVLGTAITTVRKLRRQRWLLGAVRAFRYPVVSIWTNRSLIRSMVRRDILGRYRGSFGGIFWTAINPLLLMITYFFVFGVVLRTKFGGDMSRWGFVLYFLAGMLPWLAFSEAAGRAPFVVLEHRNLVKKLVFPIETLPVNLVVTGLVTELFALLIFMAGLFAARGAVPASVLWLPVLVIPQVLFTAGMCWFLAALGVYVRDLSQVTGFALTLWFFLTPICYPLESLPPGALPVLSLNPLFLLVAGYRAIFLEGTAPDFATLWRLGLFSIFVFVAGYAWFYKLKKNFADVI